MLNPLHLRTLTAVVRTGSFAVAARELGYTPSAVSQQMAALEQSSRLVLFEREPRGITPTPAARLLVARAAEVLAVLDAFDAAVGELASGARGAVRLGSFPTASETVLPPALARLAEQDPAVVVALDEGEPAQLVPRVEAGELDAALSYTYSVVPGRRPASVRLEPLLREELAVTVPVGHPAAQEAVDLADLAEAAWIGTRPGTTGAVCLERLCAEAGFAPRIDHRSNDYDVVRALVRSGLGVALVPALAWSADDGVRTVRLDGVRAHRQVGVLTRSGDTNPALARVLAALRAAARGLHDPAAGITALRE